MKQVEGNQQLVTLDDTDIYDGDVVDAATYTWRRLAPDESIKQYAYFKAYLGMPLPRNLGRLAKQYRITDSFIRLLSSKFKWRARAADYDDHEAAKIVEQARIYNQKREAEWSKRRDKQREAEWKIAQDLLVKVRSMLQVPLFKQTIVDYITTVENEEIDPDVLEKVGSDDVVIIKKVIINEPLDWSAIDIARFFDVASKMARLATGMATEHKQMRIDVSKLTDEELERLKNE